MSICICIAIAYAITLSKISSDTIDPSFVIYIIVDRTAVNCYNVYDNDIFVNLIVTLTFITALKWEQDLFS